MRVVLRRNGVVFGPYTADVLRAYVSQGKLMLHDLAKDEGSMAEYVTVKKYMLRNSIPIPQVGTDGFVSGMIEGLRRFDSAMLWPWPQLRAMAWIRDRRLLALAGVGLTPMAMLTVAPNVLTSYWAIAFYFSAIWALFFYHLFRTPETTPRNGFVAFFITAFGSIPVLLILQSIPPWNYLYELASSQQLHKRFIGMFLGVGMSEEFCKACILFWLVKRPGILLLPQTVVFYGMISGLGFGIYEGVAYQLAVNRDHGIDGAYFLNIVRLTSLPFLHSLWTGIAGYFIAFATLNPTRRHSLWFIAIILPAVFHAVYNTFGWGFVGITGNLISVILLSTYLARVSELQQSLSTP